ncbi:MAG: CinA family nicotinamide mononucleotide deamidase-related protein [bacterium]|nr:CinA family nicotinamide mononucleotide deamidase-related protein [bacterium]
MKAEIVGIGDELLYGFTTNTNAARIAEMLLNIGIEPRYMTTVGDNERDMMDALIRARMRSDIVITTGGLGPTPDDITQKVVAKLFGLEIQFYEGMMKDVEEKYARLNRPVPEFARNQAEFPVGATPIYNPIGTASGIEIVRENKYFYSLPGVPSEAMIMMEQYVIPKLESIPKREYVAVKLIRTASWGETQIQTALGKEGLKQIKEAGCSLAFLPKHGLVDLRLTAKAKSLQKANEMIEKALPLVLQATSSIRYHIGNESLIEVILNELTQMKKTVAFAESCTGGALSSMFTEVPGISRVFKGAVIAYHNAAKKTLLGVPAKTIDRDGAVSKSVVRAMASGAIKQFDADFAIAITGISGPSGATPTKPVGTVWIAIAKKYKGIDKPSIRAEHFVFPGPRLVHRLRTIHTALWMLWQEMKT